MARITDQKKIDRLKAATMKQVSKKGYGGASAAAIATTAKIANGYFYLHYKGKYELVNSLLTEIYQEIACKLEELIEKGSSFDELIESFILYLFQIANKEPVKIKFFNVLLNDNMFKADVATKESIFNLINKVMVIGKNSGDLDDKITFQDLYLLLVINTIQFINQKLKNSKSSFKFTEDDEKHLIYLLRKILK